MPDHRKFLMVKSETLARAVCVPLTCVCLLGLPASAHAQTASTPVSPVNPVGSVNESVNKDVQRQEDVTAAPAGSWAGDSLGTLFGGTIQDFRRLPSQDALKWLAIGAVAASIGRSIDQPVSRGLSTSPLLDDLFEPGETIGGARFQLGGALVTYAVGRMTRSPKVTLVGADLLQAHIMSQVLTAAVKMSVRRTRPDDSQYSFPSGHAAVTFASATVLQRDLGWKFGLPAYGVATYVAASRIQEKRHFLSDVAFGAAIGILAGRTVTVGHGDGRFAIAPVAAPGGGGVSFTWVGR